MATAGKPITCKAALLWEFNKPMTIETIQVEPPKFKEVRIKVSCCGLCHSDLACLEGYFSPQKLPCILGHEGAGIVESVGDGVTSVKPGDKVLSSCMPQCRQCPICLDGRSNACIDVGRKEKRDVDFLRCLGYDGTPRFFHKGNPVYYFAGCSTFSEYTVLPANSCVKIDPKAPLDKVCLCACGIPTGYGASTKTVNMRPGDKAAIWGVGGVGLATVIGCKDKGASQIIGVAVTSNKEVIARQMGCTDFIASRNLNKPLPEIITEMTNGGLDFAFVCVGDPKSMECAVLCTKPGGTTVVVGATEASAMMQVSPGFLLSGRKIVGTSLGDYKPLDDIPGLVTSYMTGQLPLDNFISGHFKFENINEAFDQMKAGKGLRSVILM